MKITDENSMRSLRKDEHVKYFLEKYNCGCSNGFEDVIIQNNSLPELNFEDIDTSCTFMGKKIAFPLLINAMTGGTEYTGEINRQLAELSGKHNLPIATGSQTIALNDSKREYTFRVIREINRRGVVIANVSANSHYEKVLRAVAMLEADAVQLHLNVAQEIFMTEGDRNFRGIVDNISEILRNVDIPVIVKEVGFGISHAVARRLAEIGVSYIDIGGKGGTNFIEIEGARSGNKENAGPAASFLEDWGILAACSLLQCRSASSRLNIISSGGIRKAEEIVKSICMGADMTAVGGRLLYELLTNGFGAANKWLERLMYETRVLMLLVGAGDLRQLKKVPYLLKGTIKELCE